VNDSTTFYNSDAWVLLAIIYASRSGPATLDKIIAAGDAINVAIFLPNELEGGLARLTAGGYITEHEGAFAPTEKALAYSGSSRHRRAMLKELRDVQRMLASRSTEPPERRRHPTNRWTGARLRRLAKYVNAQIRHRMKHAEAANRQRNRGRPAPELAW
jgi:hypothetical protein